jgi:drug/metabolite transporter (DMT)-like permease
MSQLTKGSLLALLAFFFMALFGIATKYATIDTSKIWVSFISYLVAVIILLPYVLTKGISFFKTNHPGLHFLRGSIGTAASFSYMLSLQQIPLANATLLFNTAPLFIPMMAYFWLKEKLTPLILASTLIGFFGVILILHPQGSLLTQSGDLLGLASGLFLAVAYLSIKVLTKTDSRQLIIFNYFLIGTLLQIPLLFFGGEFPHVIPCLFAIVAGIFLVLAQIALVWAYQLAPANQVGVFQYSSVIFVGIFEWLFLGTIPTWVTLLGMLIVMAAGLIIIRSSHSEHSVEDPVSKS